MFNAAFPEQLIQNVVQIQDGVFNYAQLKN